MNEAVIFLAASIVTMHVPVPLHAPDQPVNVESAATFAVRVTTVPELYASEQSTPQFMPDGLLVTVPPAPAVVMERV